MNKSGNPNNKLRILFLCVLAVGILISFAFLFSPDESVNYENSSDFNFRLNFNTYGKDQIDTFNGTFTKDLVLDGTKTIDFKLPDDVKSDIFKLMKEIDILSYPDVLGVEGVSVTPSCNYKLTVTIGGKTKTVEWPEGFYPGTDTELPQRNRDFLKVVRKVSDYIYGTDAYKSMPKANGGYD